ncbi:MAG: hypothetical protein IPJ81_18045 [Chitinophagaceae bacterium]|nr:hypothetical protein [Chitinophagaceae bacterium]
MLITKNNPVGIDILIQEFQQELHDRLMQEWGLNVNIPEQNALYECYGRCYRNKKNNGYIAEVYNGSNEYKEVYWNDKLNAISFFGIGSNETHDNGEKANIHLIFFVNLEKLKPSILHRADEEVRKDVQIIASEYFGFVYKSTDLWLENVLKEYPGSRREDRLNAVDMQPIHCFRLNFELYYNKNIC